MAGPTLESAASPLRLRIAVIGAGALGSELCRLLLDLRYPAVHVIDPDTLAPHNLPLSPLFRSAMQRSGQSCLGTAKAEIIAWYANHLSPTLGWQSHSLEVADLGLGVLQPFDLLFSCTDSTLARLETAYAARSLGLPVIDGGVQPNGLPEGRVSWFPPAPAAACPLCGLTEARRAQLLTYACSGTLGCSLSPDFPAMTGAPFAVEAVARAMLQLFTTMQLHPGLPANESFTQPIKVRTSGSIRLTLSPTCPWHQLPGPSSLVSVVPQENFNQTIERLNQTYPVLELPWPICLQATCLICGSQSTIFRRTAYTRRLAPCPECAAVGTLEPMETLSQLRHGDPYASRFPSQLGLPDRQLYRVRQAFQAKPQAEMESE